MERPWSYDLKTWDVFFMDDNGRYRSWAQRVLHFFLKPGFRHVVAVSSETPHVIIEPSLLGLRVKFCDPAFRDGLAGNPDVVAVLGVTVARRKRGFVPFPLLLGCAQVIKNMLGLTAFGVVTPWQLFQQLEKRK